jgi:hypothetical protein
MTASYQLCCKILAVGDNEIRSSVQINHRQVSKLSNANASAAVVMDVSSRVQSPLYVNVSSTVFFLKEFSNVT